MYAVGEIVLMQWEGWLKAFRVVEVYVLDDGQVEYKVQMLDMESSNPGWIRSSS